MEPVVFVSKFSWWKKLNKATSLVYKFLYKCKRKDQTDHLQAAKLYLIKAMQKESFCRELSSLKDSTKSKTPSLVKNLNVFLDQEGILRIDGRIANSKRWGQLDMSTKTFKQTFIRFCNSYGIPSYFYCDNVRSFDNALCKDIIEHHLDSNEFRNNFLSHTINHIKIPLYSPWMGSVWKRMIKTTKTCLFKNLRRAKSFQLLIMISHVQRTIDSRPLTYWSTSDTEVLSLIPNAFLHPNVNEDISVKADSGGWSDMQPTSRSQLLDAFPQREKLLNNFQELWNEEYLLSLRKSCNDLHDMDFNNKIQVKNVVLIKNPAKTRPK